MCEVESHIGHPVQLESFRPTKIEPLKPDTVVGKAIREIGFCHFCSHRCVCCQKRCLRNSRRVPPTHQYHSLTLQPVRYVAVPARSAPYPGTCILFHIYTSPFHVTVRVSFIAQRAKDNIAFGVPIPTVGYGIVKRLSWETMLGPEVRHILVDGRFVKGTPTAVTDSRKRSDAEFEYEGPSSGPVHFVVIDLDPIDSLMSPLVRSGPPSNIVGTV